MTRPIGITYRGEAGTLWTVWDVVDGRRVSPGTDPAERRLFVRAQDGWVYAHGPPWRGYATTWSLLGAQLARALGSPPLRARGEPDADYEARVAAGDRALRAAATAQWKHSWATAGLPCPPCTAGCPWCAYALAWEELWGAFDAECAADSRARMIEGVARDRRRRAAHDRWLAPALPLAEAHAMCAPCRDEVLNVTAVDAASADGRP